ncbi:putative nitrogen assimilation transcription factor nirA [Triangularia verruculosa]|uniref:Nitrogen assimilation transcription factor nirA n=1 Tax=Triangularia verruculosa TaxID=2587418 RepID=A0AAN6X8U6_9PEZI|nr:putative nitrogen assimilation transcription factor nirA [Triangularia verruculosa]
MDRPPPRPLLPAPPSFGPRTGPSTSGTPLPPRRSAAIAACELCREKKAKCDSRRPSCGRCLSNGVRCHYTTKINETLTQADKREKQRFKQERDDLLHLLSSIRDKPEVEAKELFARIRVANDPFQVTQSLRHAELFLRDDQLMPPKPLADLLIPPESSEPPSDTSEPEDLRVPAKPWTNLVGDAVVSRLMTRFFLPDFQLFPAIDKGIFIADMRGKNSTQFKLCSALLVNAMCALPCFELAANTSLAELFLNNSKALLEREYGRPSLPTALALYLLYITSTLLGRDRAGLHFRQTSVDMFGWLDLEERMTALSDSIPAEALERRAISKALWGMFVADSRTFLLYNRPPLLRPPSIPRVFLPDLQAISSPADASTMSIDGADVLTDESLLDALCRLAELQYTIALYEAGQTTEVGSAADLSTRQAILCQWKSLSDALSSQLRVEPTPPAPTCYLR